MYEPINNVQAPKPVLDLMVENQGVEENRENFEVGENSYNEKEIIKVKINMFMFLGMKIFMMNMLE